MMLPQALSSMDVGGQQVYVPDERGCLLPATDLVYNDAPWLDSAGPSKAASVVHPKISNEVLICQFCLVCACLTTSAASLVCASHDG